MTAAHGIKHLVLVGLGRAHIQVLRGLADSRPADLHLTVIAPRPQALMSPMVPGFVAGRPANRLDQRNRRPRAGH